MIAEFGWTTIAGIKALLAVSVECKSSRKYPWVAFYDDSFSRTSSFRRWGAFADASFDGDLELLAGTWLGKEPFDASKTAAHLAAAHSGDNNPANDAVRQSLAGVQAVIDRYRSEMGLVPRCLVVLSVVVTAAPLFACRLDNDGKVLLDEVEGFDVWATRSTADGAASKSEARPCSTASQLR